jgi:hypothetical protein
MSRSNRVLTAAIALACLMATPRTLSSADRPDVKRPQRAEPLLPRTIVLDGSALLSAGNLQMNFTNFGFLGSMPSSRYEMADYPSAQWPAGSGVEYLYAAGIWVAATMDWIESVSTGYPETEFYPGENPEDIVYRSYEGAPNGTHYPGRADDDGDGKVDEDWLNGKDDDHDGRIDEDYAAYGKLMYSCWFRDDEQVARAVWPEHTPLHIGVQQEAYQWGEDEFKDFVAVHYNVVNVGFKYLTGVYLGIYADLDAGPRNRGNYHKDDLIGMWQGIWCAPVGESEWPVRVSIVYVYDNDGDGGRTPGYFGVALLGHTTRIEYLQGLTPTGKKFNFALRTSPELNGVRVFAGLLPYLHGGEPVNDTERYAAISKAGFDRMPTQMNDYKVLLSFGPFSSFPPESVLTLDIAYVAGNGLEDMLDNAAAAALLYQGMWTNYDGRYETGVSGRETPLPGPLKDFVPDVYAWDGETYEQVPKGDTVWANLDADEEYTMFQFGECHRPWTPYQAFQTGVDGKETHALWVTSSSPPPPHMRLVAGDKCVTVYWDNLSEIVPDPISMKNDFEGYEIWRADNWHRPIGTTTTSGPSTDLWHLIAKRDLVNGLLPDDGFKLPIALGGWQYEPLACLEHKEQLLRSFEEGLIYDPAAKIPCLPGLTPEDCDTLEALARWNLGLDGGRQYYKYTDKNAKNGMPYFYSVVAWDHTFDSAGNPSAAGRTDSPYSNFKYIVPQSSAQEAETYRADNIYVVPNPVRSETLEPWRLGPTNTDPSGEKIEFRNLPRCASTVKIYTLAGDLVITLQHDGTGGVGTLPWNLVSRNGQTITSGVYLYSVEPHDSRFSRFVGKFVVIR